MIWYAHLFKNFPHFFFFLVILTVNKTEVDVFLEFPCFLCDPANVHSLISGSSAFPIPSLYIWKFLVYMLLKPGMRYFEHNLTSRQNECNCTVVNILWHCYSLGLVLKLTFSSPMATAEFSKFSGALSAVLS